MIAVDAPGHGTASAVRADLWQTADLLAETAAGTYVGYSMGARMVLHVALAHPDRVERLVLVSGTAGIEDAAERAARVERDEELARSLERDGLDAFLERWLAQPLFATLPANRARRRRAAREHRRRARVEPAARRHRHAGLAVGPVARTSTCRCSSSPGRSTRRFTATANRMADAIGANATLRVMPDAGHACHREREPDFSTIVLDWLAQGT